MEQDNTNLVASTCPVCYGVLQEVRPGLYQCPFGHEYTLQELIAKQNQTIESLLWRVYRIMNERDNMLTLLVQQEPALSSLFEQQAADFRAAATIVRSLL